MTYTPAQLTTLARNAGFTGRDIIVTAVAIALAESGGEQNATHRNTNGSTDYGLWQINDKAHPDKIGEARGSAEGNAHAAFLVYREKGNFTPWSVYNSGAYKTHLDDAKKGYDGTGDFTVGTDTTIPSDVVKGNVGGLGDIPGAISGAINAFNQSIFKLSANIGVFLGAIVLIILAVVILLRKPIATGVKTAVGVRKGKLPL